MLRIENDNVSDSAFVESRGFVMEGIYEEKVTALVDKERIYVLIGGTLISMDLELHTVTRRISSRLFSSKEDQLALMRETSISYNDSVLFVMGSNIFIVNTITAATIKMDAGLVNLIDIAYDHFQHLNSTEVLTALCN